MTSETVYALLTLIAIFAGPISAVLVTRFLDARNASQQRKYKLFRDLMQTRGIRLDPVHVAALNVVDLEFYNHQNVRTAFKSYIEHLSSPAPTGTDEDQERYFDQRADLFMDLIHEIGEVVGYRFDKRELERRSYVPQGWGDDQIMQRKNAAMLGQLLEGQRPLPVTNFLAQHTNFPPPPEVQKGSDTD